MPSFHIVSRFSVPAIFLAALCCLFPPSAVAEPCIGKDHPPGCTGQVPEPKPVDQKSADSKQAAAPPNQIVKAVYSLDTFKYCHAKHWKSDPAAACNGAPPAPENALTGAGDIVAALDAVAYDAAVAYAAKAGATQFVYFNGVELKDETQLTLENRFGGNVYVRIHLMPKEKAKLLWAAIIREESITGSVPLRVGFGWNGGGATSTTTYVGSHDPRIAVSDPAHLIGAIGAVALIVGFALAFGAHTNILRDRYPRELTRVVAEARALRRQLDRLSIEGKSKLLSAAYPAYVRGPDGYDVACRHAGDAALRDPAAAPVTPELTIGLAESDISYSLTRIQLFAWFLFAISAGIYFWFLLGELPAIDNSILGLLGISAGTAGVSWAVDASDKAAVKQPNAGFSQGLLSDMTRSAEDKDEIHRFQAVVVNVLLLAIGIVHVVRSISYPTFDPTWLIFLTISGATFALGKQMNEKK
ncbi:hypothetical protein [Pseudoduganella armeniaca]|uniref:Uncharacterized protein n=1 Tax=Pseudoduganella armeniaca TaxID=2072590 RepID=A0A2R4CD32_9BURK|nr:hypothetical protein [Pseudoduganella armeniaca]AVR97378.1 hypothetical protein C9I28_18320 [Pseudoduganella armeniaca]